MCQMANLSAIDSSSIRWYSVTALDSPINLLDYARLIPRQLPLRRLAENRWKCWEMMICPSSPLFHYSHYLDEWSHSTFHIPASCYSHIALSLFWHCCYLCPVLKAITYSTGTGSGSGEVGTGSGSANGNGNGNWQRLASGRGASNCFVFVCLIGKSHTQKCTARNEFILFFLSFLKNSQRPDGVDLETNEQGH